MRTLDRRSVLAVHFLNEDENIVTVNGERYRNTITELLLSRKSFGFSRTTQPVTVRAKRLICPGKYSMQRRCLRFNTVFLLSISRVYFSKPKTNPNLEAEIPGKGAECVRNICLILCSIIKSKKSFFVTKH